MTGRRRLIELKPFVAGEHACSKCGGATTIVYSKGGTAWIDQRVFHTTSGARTEQLMIICEGCGFVDAMACKDNAT
jgi:hypothetical protein